MSEQHPEELTELAEVMARRYFAVPEQWEQLSPAAKQASLVPELDRAQAVLPWIQERYVPREQVQQGAPGLGTEAHIEAMARAIYLHQHRRTERMLAAFTADWDEGTLLGGEQTKDRYRAIARAAAQAAEALDIEQEEVR